MKYQYKIEEERHAFGSLWLLHEWKPKNLFGGDWRLHSQWTTLEAAKKTMQTLAAKEPGVRSVSYYDKFGTEDSGW